MFWWVSEWLKNLFLGFMRDFTSDNLNCEEWIGLIINSWNVFILAWLANCRFNNIQLRDNYEYFGRDSWKGVFNRFVSSMKMKRTISTYFTYYFYQLSLSIFRQPFGLVGLDVKFKIRVLRFRKKFSKTKANLSISRKIFSKKRWQNRMSRSSGVKRCQWAPFLKWC